MITLRNAKTLDAQQISILVNSAYRGDSSKTGWTTEADLLGGQRTDPEKLIEIISDPKSLISLAFDEDELVGCIEIRKESNFVYFGMLTVNPLIQNKGIAKILLNHLDSLAKSWGLTKIRMSVLSQRRELIEFYQRRGFSFTGETEPFPSHDPRFGIPKTKLEFHIFEKVLI